jgi:hypothetical protein
MSFNLLSRALTLLLVGFCLGAAYSDATNEAPAPGSPSLPDQTLLTPARAQELFDGLDLSLPGLEPVRQAVARGDDPAARHLLAEYFRQRTTPPWKFDPHRPDRSTPYDKQIADDALRGHLKGGPVLVYADFPDNKIDWTYNATFHQPGVIRNPSWPGLLSRMDFWEDLAAAYRATGDEKYAQAWVRQMRSFIQECPPPPDAGGKPSLPGPTPPLLVPPLPPGATPTGWTPIDVGVRLGGSWPDAFYSFVDSPSVSDDDLLLFVYGCLLHGEWLSTHHGPGNGWMIERTGLYTLGAIFPEFKQSAQWRQQAVRGQKDQEAIQFLPDGVENELTTGYHNVCIDCIVGIPQVAQIVGRLEEIPPDYTAPLEKAYDFDLYMTAPDRQMPMFNDSWAAHVQGFMKTASSFFPDRQDYRWIATDGRAGQPPMKTSYAFDYGGFYAMRSGWDLHANYLVFRDSPFVFSHGHQDKLNLVMWAYGREILFNSGGGAYDWGKWRQYSIDTFSKNTVLVDGLPQRQPRNPPPTNPEKIDSRWETTPDHDFVAGIYDGAYGDKNFHLATHYRRVLFVKPDLAIVADTLTPHDTASHTYQARWHLLTTKTALIGATKEVLTQDAKVANLDVVPLQPDGLEVRAASGQTTPELLGWNVLHTTVSQPDPATTVLHTRHGAGVQTFLTLLVPMPPGVNRTLLQSVRETGPGSAEVICDDGRKLDVVASADPMGTIEVTETRADGSPGRHVIGGLAK